MRRIKTILLAVAALILLSQSPVFSQSEGSRLAFGFYAGGNKYWGEFTDNQFWLYGEGFLRYNIWANVSLQASFGLTQLRWKTDGDALTYYKPYFDSYTKPIAEKNSDRIMTYELIATYNFFSTEGFVPFLFAGAGLMNFEPKIGDTGYDGAAPNNAADKYKDKKSQIIFPLGVGFETYITDNFVLNGKITYRLLGSDYIDDIADENYKNWQTPNKVAEDIQAKYVGSKGDDKLLTFGLGLSYYILGDADYDKDGLTNAYEKQIETDPKNPDTDGDGLQDGAEVKKHHTNPRKIDTDGDNLNDFDEVMKYKTNPNQVDTDADGLQDGDEIARKLDPLTADTDGDRLLDGDEVNKYTTDPLNPDTDGDELRDGDEVLKYNTNPKSKDTDADGLSDGDEVNKYKTNPANPDTDSDGLNDGLEVNTYKTDPNNPDTDGDVLQDGAEVNQYLTNPLKTDTDNDGLNDGDEVLKYKTNPANPDTDKDALIDGDEINIYKTDPTIDDTDKDGLKDGYEVQKYKTDPLKTDTDGDDLSDGEEVLKYKTNPLSVDTDNDKLADGVEVNKTKTDPINPDTDGDKVIDGDDDCPLVPGEASTVRGKNGCPQPPKIGTKTDFPDILFLVNTDKFNFDVPATALNLAKLLEYVKQCDGLQVAIEGHASEEGNPKRNKELSELRAKKVVDWLLSQGVKASAISGAVGYGSAQPKIKEPTGKDAKGISKDELENIRKQNRRITVKVTKTCD